jgi:hypothetical protein
LGARTGFEIRRVDDSVLSDVDEAAARTINAVSPNTLTSVGRISALIDATRYLVSHDIRGAIVECGVWRGGSMQAVARTLSELGDQERDLYLYDTFSGMTAPGPIDVRISDGAGAETLLSGKEAEAVRAVSGLPEVQAVMASTGYPDSQIHYVVGPVEETIPGAAPDRIALLRLDTDWYESTRHELEHLYPRLVPGGVLIIDDYGWWAGARKAVDEFLELSGERLLLVRVDSGRVAVKLPR